MTTLPAEIMALKEVAETLETNAQAVAPGDEEYLRFTKYGQWEIADEEVDGKWAIHPGQLQTGWIAWGDREHGTEGEMLGKVLVPASQLPPLETDLNPVEGKWSRMVSMQLACIAGDSHGVQAVFATNSTGGRKAYATITRAIVSRLRSGEDRDIVPVVELTSDSYTHKKYGKIYTPVLDIVDWVPLMTLTMDEEDEEDVLAIPAKRGRRGRR